MIVHLVGKGPGYKDAPERAEEAEDVDEFAYQVWGCNDVPLWKKVDLLFMMHDLAHVTEQEKICAIMMEQQHTPILSVKEYDWLANARRYPIEDICEEFGGRYFSDSICYMIAYAIYTGATEIHTWGINLHSVTRDFRERYCVEFWLGIAVGCRIHVHTHEPTALLKTNEDNQAYGFDCYFHYNTTGDDVREWGLGGLPDDKIPTGELL